MTNKVLKIKLNGDSKYIYNLLSEPPIWVEGTYYAFNYWNYYDIDISSLKEIDVFIYKEKDKTEVKRIALEKYKADNKEYPLIRFSIEEDGYEVQVNIVWGVLPKTSNIFPSFWHDEDIGVARLSNFNYNLIARRVS